MEPDDQEYVFKSLEDMYVKHGMDPAGILAVDGKEVHMAAHGKDWTGKRTGASLIPVPGEKGSAFMKRFSKAYNIQMDFNEQAFDMGLTKDWDAAFEGSADAMGMENTDLNSSTTDSEIRTGATKILKPTADEVKQIVQSNSGNPAQIRAQTRQIVSQGLPSLNKPNRALLSRLQGQAPNNRGQSAAMRWGRQNLRMEGLGGAAGLMLDPEAAKKFAEGDYIGGLQTGAKSAVYGEFTSQVIQKVSPHLGKLFAGASRFVAPVAKVASPIGQVAVGTQVANELVKAGTGEGFVKKLQNVRDKQRTATINEQQQQTSQQLAINREQTGQDQSVADNVTNVIATAVKNPLSIFGIN